MNDESRPASEINRRTLIKGAAVAAPIVLGANAFAGSRRPTGPLRVGLVGCGGRGTGAALQAMKVKEDVVLAAVADLFPGRIEPTLERLTAALTPPEEEPDPDEGPFIDLSDRIQVDEDHRFVGLDSYRQLIDSVDVVLLATPPVFRPLHMRHAVEQGKHVFAEKPWAVDAPGVRSVLASAALAREKRLSLVSGFCWRYNVRHRALFERVREGAIGDVRAFYSTYLASPNRVVKREEGWTDVEFQIRNWYHTLWASGDHVVEQAIHSLDKQSWTFRDAPPLRVTATGGRQTRKSGNIWDHFAATFDYADGAKAFHTCRQSENCDYDNNDWIFGAKGNAYINNWAPLHEITGENPWVYEGEGNDMYQQEHDELFASIVAGEPINDGEWAARSTMLGIMTRMSAYTGRTITWEQAMGSEERLGPDPIALADFEMRAPAIPGKTSFV